MEAYGFPGLEEQKIQHRDFAKKPLTSLLPHTLGMITYRRSC
jgi:hypothetical protein